MMRRLVPAVLGLAVLLGASQLFAAQSGKISAPKLYAALFDSTRTWTYEINEVRSGDLNDDGKVVPIEKRRVKTTCKVAKIKQYKRVLAARVTCTPLPKADAFSDKSIVDGTYLANSKGVWKVHGGLPADDAAVKEIFGTGEEESFFLPAKPKAGTKRKSFDGGESTSTTVTKPYKGKLPNGKDGQGWCITTTSQEAHETVEGYCFVASAGIVEAVDENHGGESMESKATLVK